VHARVTTFSGDPSRLDEAAKMINDEVIPAARSIEGFKGGYWLADRSTGKVLSVALWDSEDALRDSEPQLRELRERSRETGRTPLGVEAYEVIAQA
jgi:hypothetical protein